jgi:hypothetical protein
LGIYTWTTRYRWRGYALLAAALAVLAVVPSLKRGALRPSSSDPPNRLAATASAILTGQDTRGTGLGTMRFRLTMYRGVLEELRQSQAWQWLAGHGTAAGGRIGLRLFPQAYRAESLDANRVIHDEWLRVTYELGLIGLTLFVAVLSALAVFAIRSWRSESPPGAARAFTTYLPALLLGMTTENVIDGAGNVVTTGFVVLAAFVFAARAGYPKRRDPSIAAEPGKQHVN